MHGISYLFMQIPNNKNTRGLEAMKTSVKLFCSVIFILIASNILSASVANDNERQLKTTIQLDPQASITETLTQAKNRHQYVEVYLRGGQSFKGVILGIANETVVIGFLAGKEFFDVQIVITDISAVSLQTRNE